MVRRSLLLLAATFLLASCALTLKQEEQQQKPAEAPSEGEHITPARPLAGTGALEERLLETGILETGNAEAPLVLLMFTNHSCFYCGEFQREHFGRLLQDFIAPGTLRLQVAVLPLRKYPWSNLDASALICAAEEGKGFAMHERLFALRTHTREAVLKEATNLKLDESVFRPCLDDAGTELLLAQHRSAAASLGVSLVPTFFLNGEKFIGLPDYAELRGRLEAAQDH